MRGVNTYDAADVFSPPRRARPESLRVAAVDLLPPVRVAGVGGLEAVRRVVDVHAEAHLLHLLEGSLLPLGAHPA